MTYGVCTCRSSNGVIAHNRLFNMKGFAIQMSPEYLWVESDFVNNVLVLNNTINSYSPGIWLGVDPTVRTRRLILTAHPALPFTESCVGLEPCISCDLSRSCICMGCYPGFEPHMQLVHANTHAHANTHTQWATKSAWLFSTSRLSRAYIVSDI